MSDHEQRDAAMLEHQAAALRQTQRKQAEMAKRFEALEEEVAQGARSVPDAHEIRGIHHGIDSLDRNVRGLDQNVHRLANRLEEHTHRIAGIEEAKLALQLGMQQLHPPRAVAPAAPVESEGVKQIRANAEAQIAKVREAEKIARRARVAERRALAEAELTPRCDEIRDEAPEVREARRALEAVFPVDRHGAGWIQSRVREMYERAVCTYLEGEVLAGEELEQARKLAERTQEYAVTAFRRDTRLWNMEIEDIQRLRRIIWERAQVFIIANRTANAPIHLIEHLADNWFLRLDLRPLAQRRGLIEPVPEPATPAPAP